jgi:hypothetical protein
VHVGWGYHVRDTGGIHGHGAVAKIPSAGARLML